jgi:general secretion pathway protein D
MLKKPPYYFRIVLILSFIMIVSCASKKIPKIETINLPARLSSVDEKKQAEPQEYKEKDAGQKTEVHSPQENAKEAVRQEREKENEIVLNLDGADIGTAISSIGEMLNINFILSPEVKGKVTIQTYKKFPSSDLFQIFQTILEINGLTAVIDGPLYRIVPIDVARQQALDVQTGRDYKRRDDSSFVTQIVPLEHVRAGDILNVVRNLMPRGADLIVYEPSNIIIVTAPAAALTKFMKIIEILDVNSLDRESVKSFVYHVENGEAKKLADILKNLYVDKKTQSARVSSTPVPSQIPKPNTPASPGKTAAPTYSEELPGHIDGEIIITPYEEINALIIKTSTGNYLAMLDILKKIDIPAKQVLIEVLIAEVSLTDKTQFGLGWILKGNVSVEGRNDPLVGGFTSSSLPGTIVPTTDSVTGQFAKIVTTFPTGTAFAAVIRPDKYGAILNAFASLGKLNVLASPHILATDNIEAKIEIGDEIPIATGFQQQPSTSTTTGTTAFVAAGQIQYRTTGILLTVLPNISEKNSVKLKISQEISNRGVDIALAGITSPSFTKRKAETVGIVENGHTLIIGGLISEQNNNSREGIPLLSRIPLIGYLFGVLSDEIKKTELLIMVTPHVAGSPEEADKITRDFQYRVKTISKKIDMEKAERKKDEAVKQESSKEQE